MSQLEQSHQELEQARAEYRYSVEKMHEAKQRVSDLRNEHLQFEANYDDRIMRRDNINAELRETRREVANLEKSLSAAKARLAELEARAKRVVRPEAQRAGKALDESLSRLQWAEQQFDISKQAVHLATEKTKSAEIAYRLAGGKLSRQEMLAESNPWKSGSFYFTVLVVILVTLSIIAANLPWYAVGTVIIGGILALAAVGAFQLRQDAMLSEENFLKLMVETFKRLPLLTQKSSDANSGSDVQEGTNSDSLEKNQ